MKPKQKKRTRRRERATHGDSQTYSVLYRLLARFFLWLFRVRIYHVERQPANEAYLLCCNHISAFDPILLAAALPAQQTHFMAKKELFRIPGLAHLLRALNVYPVDRSGDVGAIKCSIELLEDGNSVGMFPQGTRCPGCTPREAADMLKNGAGLLCDKTHVTVLPVCLRAKKNRLRLFCGVDLIVGEPIPYEQMTRPQEQNDATAHTHHAEYARISNIIFERICELYEEKISDEA